jgi:glycerol-3-phosphate dehydrogenase (NAD(P)+)
MKSQRTVVEGYWATECFWRFAKKHNVAAPILEKLYEVMYQNVSPQKAVAPLMQRGLKAE